MHNRYGEVLTWKPLSSSDRHARLWNDYAEDHKGVDQFYHELLVEYLDKFRSLSLYATVLQPI